MTENQTPRMSNEWLEHLKALGTKRAAMDLACEAARARSSEAAQAEEIARLRAEAEQLREALCLSGETVDALKAGLFESRAERDAAMRGIETLRADFSALSKQVLNLEAQLSESRAAHAEAERKANRLAEELYDTRTLHGQSVADLASTQRQLEEARRALRNLVPEPPPADLGDEDAVYQICLAGELRAAIRARTTAPASETETNQCDGCRAGKPLDEDGIHTMSERDGYQDLMRCQASKYRAPAPSARKEGQDE